MTYHKINSQTNRNTNCASMDSDTRVSTFERAIVHVNGDSLFASVEQSKHKQYKNKPVVVVTAKGVLLSVSDEAKKLGVTISISFKEIKKLFPTVIILVRESKGYISYQNKIERTLKRYTQEIEMSGRSDYFADITGLRTLLKMTYKEIGESISCDFKKNIGIYLPTSLSTSKVLAHLGSKDGDPKSLQVVNGRNSVRILKKSFVEDIWSITSETIAYLNKLRIYSAYDLMKLPQSTVEKVFHSSIIELWKELHGFSVWHERLDVCDDVDYGLAILKASGRQGMMQSYYSSTKLPSAFEKFYTRMVRGSSLPLALQTFEERVKRHLVIPYIGKVS